MNRRCPKCGGFVPEGNNNCNHCGHKMNMFGGSGLYVGSGKNPNNIPGGNPFDSNKKNNSVGVVITIIVVFVISSVISTFFDIYNEISSEFEYYEDFVGDNENDDYYDDNDLNNKNDDDLNNELTEGNFSCFNYCNSFDYEIGANGNCLCSNGDIYSMDGDNLYSGYNDKALDSSGRCYYFCQEDSVVIKDVCYCKNSNIYDKNGYELKGNNEYLAKTLMNEIDSGKKILVYSPGSAKDEYLNPVEFIEVMSKYDIDYYYYDFSSSEGEIRNTLRQKYHFQNISMPYYSVYNEGNQEYFEFGIFTKDDLDKTINNYLNIISQ